MFWASSALWTQLMEQVGNYALWSSLINSRKALMARHWTHGTVRKELTDLKWLTTCMLDESPKHRVKWTSPHIHKNGERSTTVSKTSCWPSVHQERFVVSSEYPKVQHQIKRHANIFGADRKRNQSSAIGHHYQSWISRRCPFVGAERICSETRQYTHWKNRFFGSVNQSIHEKSWDATVNSVANLILLVNYLLCNFTLEKVSFITLVEKDSSWCGSMIRNMGLHGIEISQYFSTCSDLIHNKFWG